MRRTLFLTALVAILGMASSAMAGQTPVPPGASFNLRIHNYQLNEYGALEATEEGVLPLERAAIQSIGARDYRYDPNGTATYVLDIRLTCFEPHFAAESAMKNELEYPEDLPGYDLPFLPDRVFVWSPQLQKLPRNTCGASASIALGQRAGGKVSPLLTRAASTSGESVMGCPFTACQKDILQPLLGSLQKLFP